MKASTVRAVGSLCFASLLAAACGSRGPLDSDGVIGATDASVEAAPTSTTTVPDAGPDARTGPDLPPIVDCGICLIGECGQPILSCVGNAPCQRAFQCVITECGGSFSGSCVLQCAAKEQQGALQLLGILQCVTGKCGADCTDLLGGLGGLGGSGGSGGGTPPTPRDGGPRPAFAPRGVDETVPSGRDNRAAFERAFSAWPELLTPAK
jgi:hypothetical protein